jgi:hypothetical protein
MDNWLKDTWLKGKFYMGLLLVGGVTVLLVRAEEQQDWLKAQASLVTILSLLALMAWVWWKENHPACQLPVEATTYDRATNKVLLCVAIGFAALILNANRKDHWENGCVARAIGYGALVAGAFFIAGVLLGYLFGLRPAGTATGQPSDSTSRPYTNLEEIADWLTKLFLGAGLVELTRLQAPIKQLAIFMAHGVDAPNQQDPGSPAIALTIMGFFSASGLLYGYLWTRYQHSLKGAAPSDTARSAPEETHESHAG